MSPRSAPTRAEVQAKLVVALQQHGVVIKLVTGRMVVQRGEQGYTWAWRAHDADVVRYSDVMPLDIVAAAVLDQCGTRAVLAALEGEGG